jgi:hypothetical protein
MKLQLIYISIDIELQHVFILLCSQKLISPVPAESMSHLKTYFCNSSFNKYDICCEYGHPQFSHMQLIRKHFYMSCDGK